MLAAEIKNIRYIDRPVQEKAYEDLRTAFKEIPGWSVLNAEHVAGAFVDGVDALVRSEMALATLKKEAADSVEEKLRPVVLVTAGLGALGFIFGVVALVRRPRRR